MVLPKDDLRNLRTIEEIIMVGYPRGLWDDASHYPLIRRGITSTHPGLNFKGQNIGVIDAACFPGSSGSPIFVLNKGSYSEDVDHVDLENRPILLGVLYGGPQISVNGEIEIEEIPTSTQSYSTTKIMMNLGYYIKAMEIFKLGEHVKKLLGI